MPVEHHYLVERPGLRPNFPQLIAYLYGDSHDVDTDGDSVEPSSNEWTCLTIISRQNPGERVDIDPVSERPLILRVNSACAWLAARATYGLAVTTGASVRTPGGTAVGLDGLRSLVGEFDVDAALGRLLSSVYVSAPSNADKEVQRVDVGEQGPP